MSLMKFSPETVRLRRIAKAHAAGEFNLHEYRQARRDVIANFSPANTDDDDTQPRFETAQLEVSQAGEIRARRVTNRLLWVGMFALLLVVVFATRAFAAVEIPPVAERDPNPVTSPRLAVERVELRNFEPLPGVTADSIQAVIEGKLLEVRSRNAPGEHGFTSLELEELGRFLNALGAHETTELSARDAADLSALISEQKKRRGLSMIEIEEVAGAVQALYREAGYFLAVAFVPVQAVVGAVVDVEVLPGVLGEISVQGGKNSRLARRFADLQGKPLTKSVISTRLYAINQASGVRAQASFEPGENVGETRLNIELDERRSWAARLGLDNYGDEATGENRLLVATTWLNPTGRGDSVDLGLLMSVDPANQVYGSAEYRTPLKGQFRFRGRVANNDFTAEESIEIDGEGLLLDLAIERSMHRDRVRSMAVELAMSWHDLDWEDNLGNPSIRQQASFVTGTLNMHRIWDRSKVAARAKLYADAGRIAGDKFAGQESTFWNAGVDLFAWRPIDIAALPGTQKLSLRLLGQVSDSQLPSTRRLGFGGVAGARGFRRSVYLADEGALFSIDLRTPLPLGEFAVFADTAYGRTRNEQRPTWGHLSSVGVAWDYAINRHLMSRLSWALPVTAKGTGGLNDDGPQLFWSLQYAP